MVDPLLRSIYSAADETSADLDRLLSTSRDQRSRNLAKLEQIVAGLDAAIPVEPEPSAERHEREQDRRPPAPDPVPFVALPQRTTHGGPWGPKLRAKLTAAALEKRGW